MQDELRAAFDNLHTALESSEADGVFDEAERAELRELVGRMDGLLAAPEEHEGVIERLDELALGFENNHPSFAGVIRKVVDTLSSYGI